MEQRWEALTMNTNIGSMTSTIPTTLVELSISCRNLINKDVMSKSDPQCIVYLRDSYHDRFHEVGRTEQIRDTLNPDFVKKLTLNYNFETIQKLKFEVHDIDSVGRDFLGMVETTLGEIVAYQGRQFKKPLLNTSNRLTNFGEIILVVEEVSNNKKVANMQFRSTGIRSGFFVKKVPFLSLWKSNEDGTYSVVHKTEATKTPNSTWLPFRCRLQALCSGDMDRDIRIDCMDWCYSGSHKLIGSFHTTINTLMQQSAAENCFSLVNKDKRDQAKDRGKVHLVNIVVEDEASFLDFIRGGMEMHFAVAIDFTASNGDVRDARSLHFIPFSGDGQAAPNQYEIALNAVGNIIAQYDSKGMFPGFGFGAKAPPNMNAVSHLFPLNGNPSHPYCHGLAELIFFYRKTVNEVILYGPTNFAPVINSTAAIASRNEEGKNYFVLLIITDGIICDMHQTKHAIVKASQLPLSIIIVGVGNADFSAMDELDSDDVQLTVDGFRAARDIVQFVPLNKHLNKQGGYVHSMIDLAKEVLYEVPGQVTSYMKMKGFKPSPPPTNMASAPGGN